MFKKYKYHLALHVIVFAWGFTGILGKLIHLPPLSIVWNRTLIAFVSLLIGLKFLKLPMKIASKQLFWKTLGVGVLVTLHWLTFYKSIFLSTASLGILCLSTVTLHVTWLEPLLFKKKFSWTEFLMGLLVVVGIYIVSDDFNAQEFLALSYGLTSALFAAFFSIFNAQLAKKVSAPAITLHEMGVGFVALTVVLLYQNKLNHSFFQMSVSDGCWLIFLGVVCTSVAFLVNIEIVKKLGVFTVSLSINLEPIYTIILAVILLNENELLSYKFYVGASIIILVLIINALIKNRNGRKNLQLNISEKDY
jgi:drug/metabolite transporter (DMT)-like permease